MGLRNEAIDRIINRVMAFISLGSFLRYDKSPTYLETNAEPDNTLPDKRWVKGYIASSAQQVQQVVSNPFTYSSGITAYNPKAQTYLKIGNTYEPYGTAIWDETTGDITTNVYNGVDDFWLFV